MRPGPQTSNFRVLEDYPRRAHLEFYRRYPSPFYAVTFELDATRLRAAIVDAGVSTYAGFCWAFHRALLDIEAFRVRLHGEAVVLYDDLRLGLTVRRRGAPSASPTSTGTQTRACSSRPPPR